MNVRCIGIFIIITCAASAPMKPAALQAQSSSRYERLLSRTGGTDTLLTLAAWEDGRVTGDGKLFRYLSSSDPLVRLRAVEIIGRIQDPLDAPQLIAMLADRDERVSEEAIFAIGQLGDSLPVDALSKLERRATVSQRCLIAEALGKIGGSAGTEILQRMLQDTLSVIRQNAALALARSGDPAAVSSLLLAVHDPDPEVIWRAVYALEKTESKRIVQTIVQLLDHDNAAVRAFSARTLGKQKEHALADDSDAPRRLIDALGDEDIQVIVNAARALGELNVEAAVHPLGKLLASHPSHHVRREAARSLGAIASKKGKDYLIESCSDKSTGVRTEAVQSLARMLGDKADMFISMTLDDGDRAVVAAALESYGIAGAADKTDLLVEYAGNGKDPILQAAAVRALSHFDGATCSPVLMGLIDDIGCDWVVATEAVNTLGATGATEAIPRLITTYTARNKRVDGNIRLAILDVLIQFKAREASTLALQALEDSDPRIRSRAMQLLTALDLPLPEIKPARYYYERDFNPARKQMLSLPHGTLRATIKHAAGDIEIELFGDDAVQTVENFLGLTRSGSYNNRTFHRVVPNFVVQGGCPRGDGWGDDGHYIRSEFNRHRYERGYLGIAHDGKDTGGSQFFITHSPQHHLDGRYTIFGRVVRGMDVVDSIDQGDTFRVTLPGWD